MSTFAELRSKVSRRLLDPNNTAVSPADVDASINDAIRYWKFTEFNFNRAYATQTLTLQNNVITLPSDFLVPSVYDSGFRIEYSEQRYALAKLHEQDYDALWRGNGYGRPTTYSKVGSNYLVYPIPDRAYSIICSYLKDYPNLVNDLDANDFTINAPRLITLWATANLISEFRQDEKMESYFRNAARDEVTNLERMNDKVQGSGSLNTYF
jgi:hypothetical protein